MECFLITLSGFRSFEVGFGEFFKDSFTCSRRYFIKFIYFSNFFTVTRYYSYVIFILICGRDFRFYFCAWRLSKDLLLFFIRGRVRA